MFVYVYHGNERPAKGVGSWGPVAEVVLLNDFDYYGEYIMTAVLPPDGAVPKMPLA